MSSHVLKFVLFLLEAQQHFHFDHFHLTQLKYWPHIEPHLMKVVLKQNHLLMEMEVKLMLVHTMDLCSQVVDDGRLIGLDYHRLIPDPLQDDHAKMHHNTLYIQNYELFHQYHLSTDPYSHQNLPALF